MSENDYFKASVKNQGDANKLIGRLLDVANHDHVYAEPIKEGEYVVITASEVMAGMGFGYGIGVSDGVSLAPQAVEAPAGVSVGNGGGGGGGVSARPVAVIEIGPSGVRVKPVIDKTKLGIALIAAVGSLLVARGRMRK